MLNKVLLMGRLAKDPELKTTPAGKSVCSFSLCVARRFVKQGEERQVDYFNCVAWGSTGEFVSKFFAKGRMINVVGSLQNRNWTDTNGQKHYATDVVVDEANFCGEKKENSANNSLADEGFVTVNVDDDLPF